MNVYKKMERVKEYARTYGLKKMLKKSVKDVGKEVVNKFLSTSVIDNFAFRNSVKRLNKIKKDENGVKDAIEKSSNFEGVGLYRSIEAQQDKEELKELVKKVKKVNPKSVLEIGTAEGGTLYVWARCLKRVNKIVSVDVGSKFEKRGKFFKSFSEEKNIVTINGYSQKKSTSKKVKSELKGEVDFIFIDGDHTYEGVKKDFEIYSEIANDGGIIAFHDIIETKYSMMGVPKLWRELREDYATERIVNKDNGKKGGIGILYI